MYWLAIGAICGLFGLLSRFHFGRILLEAVAVFYGSGTSVGAEKNSEATQASNFFWSASILCLISAPLTEYLWQYSGIVILEIAAFLLIGTVLYRALKNRK